MSVSIARLGLTVASALLALLPFAGAFAAPVVVETGVVRLSVVEPSLRTLVTPSSIDAVLTDTVLVADSSSDGQSSTIKNAILGAVVGGAAVGAIGLVKRRADKRKEEE